jgi:mRNA export factor
VRFVDVPNAPTPIIASGSWDKTVRYWDIRNTSSPIATLSCGERVYAMDTGGQTLVIANAAMKFLLVDLTKPTVFLREEQSSLKHHFRSISVSPNGKVWASGSIEGRASVNAVDPQQAKYAVSLPLLFTHNLTSLQKHKLHVEMPPRPP